MTTIAEEYKIFKLEQEQYGRFRLPKSIASKYRLDNFKVNPGNKEAYDLAYRIVNKGESHHFTTYVGPCGTGKTHLAIAIGVSCLADKAIYWQVPELLEDLRRSCRDDNSKSVTFEDCKKAGCLILDDLGMQKDTPWVTEQLESLIDYRYMRELRTVITTNMVFNELTPRIASRIKGGDIATLDCADYRPILAAKRNSTKIPEKVNHET